MTHQQAESLIKIYAKAWVDQDPDLILTIFTSDATYNDPKEPENFGHEGIRAYWSSKVVGQQKDIEFELLNLWVDGDTVIAEWNAKFIDIPRNMHIDMREVAIFTVEGEKFSALREYYKSRKTSLAQL